MLLEHSLVCDARIHTHVHSTHVHTNICMHTCMHTHTLTDDSVRQEFVDGGESDPSGVSAGMLLSDHLQEGREEGGGVRDSVRRQHHQLVRQTLQVVHQRVMLLLLLGHVTGDDVIHYS